MNTHNPNAFFYRPHRPEGEARLVADLDRRAPRSVSSQTLFQGEREIGIEHAGALYRLKITRQGKLILNK